MQTHCYRPELRKVGTFALSLLMIGLLFSSCASRKDVAYVQTPEQVMTVASNGLQDARIRAKDLLTVTVESSNPEAVAAFNGIYWTPNQQYSTYAQQARTFLVDNEGNVELPVVGLTHVGGYTMREAYLLPFPSCGSLKRMVVATLYFGREVVMKSHPRIRQRSSERR